MAASEYLQILILLIFLLALAIPYGKFMAKVYAGERHLLKEPLNWLEHILYRLCGIDRSSEMDWKSYSLAIFMFNFFGFLFLLLLQISQHLLPLNPKGLGPVPFWLAVNTGISFTTNTNWQAYSGEAMMSHLTQMLGLGVQNFLSAATGMAVAVAFARSLTRASMGAIGNFWTDCIRSLVYILLPLSFIFAIALVSLGVIQNFDPYLHLKSIEGLDHILPTGPAASQIAIKQLGSNGGGFFGVNSAHPFENPTPLSNFLELFAILFLPCATPIAFGCLVKNRKHGIAIFATMSVLFLLGLATGIWSELLSHSISSGVLAGEGKEIRFGIGSSILWSIATSATSNGSVNAMVSSLSPLAGGAALLNIMLGEVVFGGVGAGMYGMATFVIITVFIAGLMVGRSPEYLGKKIEVHEIKLAVTAILGPSVLILGGSAFACSTSLGLESLLHKGPHGLSEVLYAFSSASGNNGSAFAGLNANTTFYNIALGFCMLLGRYLVVIPVLAISGSLAAKKMVPPSSGTFPLDTPMFVALLASTILIVGALTFLPALSLGPIMEHLFLITGRTF